MKNKLQFIFSNTSFIKRREIMLLSFNKFVVKCSEDCVLLIGLLLLSAIFGSIYATDLEFYIYVIAFIVTITMFEGLVSNTKENIFSLHHVQLVILYIVSILIFYTIGNIFISLYVVFSVFVSIAAIKLMRLSLSIYKYLKNLKTVEWPFFCMFKIWFNK